MIVVLWSFRARSGRESEFEAAYGPEGQWAAFFRASPDYLGTELLRPTDGEERYVTVDRWNSAASRESFLDTFRREYDDLDRECEAMTSSEDRIGTFELLS